MRQRSLAVVKAVFGPNGFERQELLLTFALVLIARGLWLVWQPGAYLVPGLVILWMVLPSRKAFVARPLEPEKKPERRT